MRGGYRIIDFKGVALTSGTQATIPGLYESASNPYRKRMQVTGLVVGTTKYPDFSAEFVPSSSNFTSTLVINGDTVEIVITSADAVTVTVTPPVTPDDNASTNSKRSAK